MKKYSKVKIKYIDGSEEIYTLEEARVFAPNCANIIIDVIPIYDTQPIADLMKKSIKKLTKTINYENRNIKPNTTIT